jgi:CO/xanthine dehydrogenase Mo-binding subunit/aerobic-type carbon monoxide dehydrogenase small subunit (CoxS/CutS family)
VKTLVAGLQDVDHTSSHSTQYSILDTHHVSRITFHHKRKDLAMLIPLPLHINGASHQFDVDPDRTLLSVLRDDLGLTGTKYGCGEGKCGSCTLLMDGSPVQSCSVTVGAAAGSRITTVEGLASTGALHPLQQAFLQTEGFQCGYCTPGMIMSAAALLHANASPTTAEIIHAMQDNICRCGSYPRIVEAISIAAAKLRNGDGATTGAEMKPLGAPISLETLQPALSATVDEGLFVAYPCPDLAVAIYGEELPPPAPETRPLQEIGPWIHIDGEGAVTVYVGKAEVGQNSRTALAQIVAEELQIPAHAVTVVMGDTGRSPFDMGTFGSRTTPITGSQLWRAGAATRDLLIDLAAAAWNVDRAELRLAEGAVHHARTGRSAGYGELARDRQVLRIAHEDQPSTPAEAWTIAGQSTPKAGGERFVTGEHRYAADTALPGMLHGKILRPPAFHAALESLDTSAAEAMEGVIVVREGDFVGVAAPDELTAARAVDAMRARWKTTLQVSQPDLFEYLKASPVEAEGRRGPLLAVEGSVAEGLAAAHLALEQRYTIDYIAHTPLEPRAALAHWQGDRLTVWTGTQRPFGVRGELALAFDLPEAQIRVIVPDTGAGYGGKHLGDAAIEAARLARAAGRPVKVVWTRQEEFTWAYFRPAGLIEISGGVDAEGRFTALEFHNYNSGSAGIESLYQIPNRHIEFHPADAPLRQGAYRALSTTANHFARESFVDELAAGLGMDPLEMRLRNLTDPRLRAVFIAAAEAFGWGKNTPPAHHGYGIAGGFDKGSYVAACVEVQMNPATRQPKVLRVVQAYECGALLNPGNVRNQVEGAIIQGLGGALFESIKFANGRILNPNFAGYRVPRFGDTPDIEVILLDRKDLPSVGAGETPIIAVAPAIGNAIYQATGVRLRSMPLALHGV